MQKIRKGEWLVLVLERLDESLQLLREAYRCVRERAVVLLAPFTIQLLYLTAGTLVIFYIRQ